MSFCKNCGKKVSWGELCGGCNRGTATSAPPNNSGQAYQKFQAANQQSGNGNTVPWNNTATSPKQVTNTNSNNPFYYFGEAIKKYAEFEGRATRKEFWMFQLISFLVGFTAGFIDGLIFGGEIIFSLIYNLFIIIPSLAIAVRRMHDVNKRGWFILVPIYSFILFIRKSVDEGNRYNA